MSKSKAVEKLYLDRVAVDGASWKALGFSQRVSQTIRYETAMKHVDFKGKSILDVGCGLGDFATYLGRRTQIKKYVGCDLNERFIKVASRRIYGKKYDFVHGSAETINEEFDICVALAVLCDRQIAGSTAENMERIREVIFEMFKMAREAVVVDLVSPQAKSFFETDIVVPMQDAVRMAYSLTPRVLFDHSYSPRSYTMVLWKGKFPLEERWKWK